MQTPDGRECKFYYLQANPRYKEIEECRIPKTEDSVNWKRTHCAFCPVPDILRANASPYLQLILTIKNPLFGMLGNPRLRVQAYCSRHEIPVPDPYVGCPQCNAERGHGLDLFAQALEDSDTPDD